MTSAPPPRVKRPENIALDQRCHTTTKKRQRGLRVGLQTQTQKKSTAAQGKDDLQTSPKQKGGGFGPAQTLDLRGII